MTMMSFAERFWSKVRLGDGCWEWIGTKSSGYGQVWRDGKMVLSHRVSWEIYEGPPPSGLFVCHHCDNRGCVRPGHLFLGTQQDNADDMVSKERQARQIGEAHGQAILTALGVAAARYCAVMFGASCYALARVLGVSWSAMDAALRRKTWRHV